MMKIAHTAMPLESESMSKDTDGSVACGRSDCRAAQSPTTVFNLFWIFVVCSVIGLVVETVVSYPIDGMWKNRAGLVWGPFSPIYGVGGVLMTLALSRLATRPAWESFVAATLVGGAFELVAGWFWKNAFGIVAWSYIDQPFNIGGYTCLGIAIAWGIAGVAWIKIGLPATLRLMALIPRDARVWLTATLAAFLAVDIAVTLMSFSFWFDRQAGLPITTGAAQFFAQNFGDDFMEQRFQTMSMWTELARR